MTSSLRKAIFAPRPSTKAGSELLTAVFLFRASCAGRGEGLGGGPDRKREETQRAKNTGGEERSAGASAEARGGVPCLGCRFRHTRRKSASAESDSARLGEASAGCKQGRVRVWVSGYYAGPATPSSSPDGLGCGRKNWEAPYRRPCATLPV